MAFSSWALYTHAEADSGSIDSNLPLSVDPYRRQRSWFSLLIWTALHASVWLADLAGLLVWPSSLEKDAGCKFAWWDADTDAEEAVMRPLNLPLASEVRLHQ